MCPKAYAKKKAEDPASVKEDCKGVCGGKARMYCKKCLVNKGKGVAV